jgi:hypothetical protein
MILPTWKEIGWGLLFGSPFWMAALVDWMVNR